MGSPNDPPPVAISAGEVAALRASAPPPADTASALNQEFAAAQTRKLAAACDTATAAADTAEGGNGAALDTPRSASESQRIRVQTVERILPPKATVRKHPGAEAPDAVPDEKLVLRSMDGDNAAFEELYHRHLSKAILAAYSILGQTEKAQDIAQEAFIEAAKQLADLREPEAFATWVRGIARHMAIAVVRKESRRLKVIRDHQDELRESPRDDQPDQAAERDERIRLIRRAIGMVPANYREILLAKYVEKMSYDEIASTFDISRAAVDKRLTRGKQLMRKIMEDLMGEGGGLA